MEAVQLSKRLDSVAKYVEDGARLADIGSDHAYLPCALIEQSKIEFAVAGEVVKGPFDRAKKEVSIRGLEKAIDVRFGNGMDVVKEEDRINTVTVCGMGGTLIQQILANGLEHEILKGAEKLILQPNVGEYTLRKYLQEKQYVLTAEEILEENDKIYEIVVVEPSDKKIQYTEKELRYGPYLLKEKSDIFVRKWTKEREKLLFVKKQIEHSKKDQGNKIKEISERIREIEEVIW